MSRLRIFSDSDPNQTLLVSDNHAVIAEKLGRIGVRFERWETEASLAQGAGEAEVFAAYREEIDRLVAENGFQCVDVVSVTPDHPEREAMRTKFLDEHSHQEDEVRFFVSGSGLFSLHVDERVYEVLCEAGDLISVPDGVLHWFDMGPEPNFTAIRFFLQPDGWVGHFSGEDIARHFPRFEKGQALP